MIFLKVLLMGLCFAGFGNLSAVGDLRSNLGGLKKSLQELGSKLENLKSKLDLLQKNLEQKEDPVIKAQIDQANSWSCYHGSFLEGVGLLPILRASFEKVEKDPNYSAQYRQLQRAFLQLNLNIITGAEDRLSDSDNERYVISDFPKSSRLSAGLEAIKSLQYLKSEDAQKMLIKFPGLSQNLKEFFDKEEGIKLLTQEYLQGAEDENAPWGAGVIAEFKRLVPTIVVARKDFGERDRHAFFKNIIGLDENTEFIGNFAKMKETLVVDPDPLDTKLFKIKGVDGENKPVTYQCGFFEKLSLKKLREEAAVKKQQGPIKFNVIERESGDYACVDIGALQADPSNKDAVFQVASNFNALETVGADDAIPTITQYVRDNTQGPRASISAAPGLIYRHYYIFYDKSKSVPEWKQKPQTSGEVNGGQINLLSGLGISVRNGYIVESINTLKDKIQEKNADKFEIGFHRDIQVTFGAAGPFSQTFFYDSSQIINQVFAAAFAVDYGVPLYSGPEAERIAKLILEWTYEATLKVAFIKDKKKVFLTRMGGGVFNNAQDWIDDAIKKAIDDPVLQNSGLEVTLNNFGFSFGVDVNPIRKRLIKLAQDNKGVYKLYKADGVYSLTLQKDQIKETKK